ncbi:MAG: FAD-binding oxidoreductase [Proteobacteria bacterium]|nr:FAD-binding oxidoreductase [Pseudomonadota bacterium]
MNAVPPPNRAAIDALLAALPADLVLTATEDLGRFSRDWSGDYHGRPLAVARPRDTAEVSLVLQHCHRLRIPVVPQGGLTGLVGGGVPADKAELVLSLERMNKVRRVDPFDFAMIVEAGCVLEVAKQAADAAGCLLPITFGAQGSCRIGGNVATNAGGFNVLRYGMTRDLVLGLEVVLADGRIWNGLKLLRKDNRGYDLKQMFIGSEGTLGVVTAAALKLFPRPEQVETALVALSSVPDAIAFYAHVRAACSDLATAFELLMRRTIDVSLTADERLADPFPEKFPVYVLLELSCGAGIDLRALLEGALVSAGDMLLDAVIASSQEQAARLWRLRETMVEKQGGGEPYLRTDVSLPISQIPAFVAAVETTMAEGFPQSGINIYGHIGDGNLHINVIPPRGLEREARAALIHDAETTLFGVLDQFGGSISAEHGIGRAKRPAFLERVDEVSLDIMMRLKSVLDPDGILSAGRLLPSP